mgnify:CR=1 FL=1
MLPGASERWVRIPDGNPGRLATLVRMAKMIREPDPLLGLVVALDAMPDAVFAWVQRYLLYQLDRVDDLVVDELHTPGYLLAEIARYGHAFGDCDDFVILLGALYRRLGYPVQMVAISRRADRELDHVYLRLAVDGEWIAADGIVPYPFGWEVSEREITNRVEMMV